MFFEEGETTDKMFLSESKDISIKDVYKAIEALSKAKKLSKTIFENDYFLLNLKEIKEYHYIIQKINKKDKKSENIELLKCPIKIYNEGNCDEEVINIINEQQFDKLSKKYCNLFFSCQSLGESRLFSKLIYGNIFPHFLCNDKHYIRNKILKNMDEKVFDTYFKRDKILDEYASVYDFESHYDEYFPENKYIIDKKNYKFKFYEQKDLYRYGLIRNFGAHNRFEDRIGLFFGKPGIGKSVTLIATLKYLYDHDKIGTFYINCKSLSTLIKGKHEEFKKLLKEEIVYLFKNEYKEYIKCCEEIDKYFISNGTIFWDFIKIVEKYLTYKEKKYLFAFDQYDDLILDPENEKIYNLFFRNKNKFSIILVSSMDDKRIRDYKINKFLYSDESEEENYFIINEIKTVLETKNWKIDNGGIYDQTYERIGKNLKNYNILKYIYDVGKEDFIDNYINDTKEDIMDYLFKFYKLDEKKDLNFLKCWANTFYEIGSLKEKKDFISFNCFDIKKNDKNQQEFEIIYLYPFIEEIMVEIFSKLFYENVKLFTFTNLLKIDAGAKGCLFEKYVIHNMRIKNNEDSLLFGYFKIDKVIKCDKFVPRKNENPYNFIKSKEKFQPGIYLFEQRIFGGKAFDAAIIQIDNDGKIFAYLFQISLSKPYDKIFTIRTLKENILGFAEYFEKVYDFMFEDIYFIYIFNSENMSIMSDHCYMKTMPCIFFDPKKEIFVDSKEEKVVLEKNEIEKYFINPAKIDVKNYVKEFQKNNNIEPLNPKQKKEIAEFIKNEKYFGIKKGQNICVKLFQGTINSILNEGRQKTRFCAVKLTQEESERQYITIYKEDEKFAKKNKNIFKYESSLFFYFDENQNIIPYIILYNGSIYKLKLFPSELVLKESKVYEIELISNYYD